MCGIRLAAHEKGSQSKGKKEESAPRQPTRDEQIEKSLRTIMEQQNVPAFSHHVFQIMSTVRDDESSLRHLTNIILRDYSLTLAALRMANSAYYNRAGKPIRSVARAVTLLGVEAVHSLVGSLVLLENYQRGSDELKELLVLSMLTANQSRQTARKLSVPGAEEAYLCGMFRNLGEVLVASGLSELHGRVKNEMESNNTSEHEACLDILGYTYEDLGRAMANNWNLPSSVGECMGIHDPNRKTKNKKDQLSTVVHFSHDLTNAVFRPKTGGTETSVGDIVEKYKSALNLSEKKVQTLISDAVDETRNSFTTVGLPLDDLEILDRGDSQSPEAEAGDMENSGADTADLEAIGSSPPNGCCDESLLKRLVEEFESMAEPSSGTPLNDILMMALEACQRGARFDRVVFGLTTPDRGSVRGRLGLGQFIDAVIEQLDIPLRGSKEPLSVALLTKKDLFVDNRRKNPYQNSPLVRTLGMSCFGLYPLVIEGLVVGCLYFDRLDHDALPAQNILDTLGRMRDVLAGVIRRTRA
jgi:HD-like signal output (HDOD) protein